MCGILAVVSNKKTLEIVALLEKNIGYLNHRGPDAERIKTYGKIVLGHKRLSIIDLSDAGIQPMESDDKELIIVLNGEIYNYIELKEELIANGIQFKTNTDTEVLLKGFQQYGAKILEKINGMFVFLIWNSRNEELFIARDRFGIKPLYYSEFNGNIVFCSEIYPIMKITNNNSPNHDLIYDYLVKANVDHTDQTFVNEIKRFPAGYYGTLKEGLFQFNQYWNLSIEVKKLERELRNKEIEAVKRDIQERFISAIILRLRSDVTVGSCLSGGIDSSSIVSIVSQLLNNSAKTNFQTFTASYGEWFKKDEKKYVDILSAQTGFKSNFTYPDLGKLNRDFNNFLLKQGEPIPTLSPFAQYCVMELARNQKTIVLLDGQGADEILAGYDYLVGYYLFELIKKFRILKLAREIFHQLKRKNILALQVMIFQLLPNFLQIKLSPKDKSILQSNFKKKYRKRSEVERLIYSKRTLNEVLISHLDYKIQPLLRWEDRNSMAFSIENRVPFLDHNFVTYILALPSSFKIKNGITKWIFREAMKDVLPEPILERRDKIGFEAPEEKWIKDENFTLINELENNLHKHLLAIVSEKKLENLLHRRTKGKLNNKQTKLLFRVACLNKWLKLNFPT